MESNFTQSSLTEITKKNILREKKKNIILISFIGQKFALKGSHFRTFYFVIHPVIFQSSKKHIKKIFSANIRKGSRMAPAKIILPFFIYINSRLWPIICNNFSMTYSSPLSFHPPNKIAFNGFFLRCYFLYLSIFFFSLQKYFFSISLPSGGNH